MNPTLPMKADCNLPALTTANDHDMLCERPCRHTLVNTAWACLINEIISTLVYAQLEDRMIENLKFSVLNHQHGAIFCTLQTLPSAQRGVAPHGVQVCGSIVILYRAGLILYLGRSNLEMISKLGNVRNLITKDS